MAVDVAVHDHLDMDVTAGVGGSRIGWAEVPQRVRAAVTAELGAEVVAEASQPGGFSPGLASRLRLADERRVFVKAVGVERNAEAVTMTRREGEILAALPADLPVAPLLSRYDDGDWIALTITDVDGRQPNLPWQAGELARVFAALGRLSAALTPSPIAVDSIEKAQSRLFGRWATITPADADRLPERVAAWVTEHLPELVELDSHAVAAARGDTLLHFDLRADNILLTADGGVVIVDWPHACLGAPWIDLLAMLPSVAMQGGGDPETHWQQVVGSTADADAVTSVLTAATGYFLAASLLPVPPNLPNLRAFQRAQGEVALDWLRTRLGR